MSATFDQTAEPDSSNSSISEANKNATDPPSQGNDSSTSGKRSIFTAVAFFGSSVAFSIASFLIDSNRRKLARSYPVAFDPRCVDEVTDSAETAFLLDLTFGDFSFVQAKLIDALWDTAVGQGGRLLHAWIMYRCVISNLLIYAMEHSTITYDFFFTLAFSQSSIKTLLKTLVAIFSAKNGFVVLYMIALLYPLCYTLLFSLIWSTATGYINLSHKLYAMPNGDIFPIDSEKLALCWALDSGRLGLPTDSVHVEVGPNFSTLATVKQPSPESKLCLNKTDGLGLSSLHNFSYTAAGWNQDSSVDIWNQFTVEQSQDENANISENFWNIHACKNIPPRFRNRPDPVC